MGAWRDFDISIVGLGHWFPEKIVVNDLDIAPEGNEVDRVVLGNLGVRQRHQSEPDQPILELAVGAARAALADANITAANIDLIILSNWTEHVIRPELAPLVAAEIGADSSFGFDICTGCCGFVVGIQTAAAYLASPLPYRTALIVSAEQFSKRIRPGSRGVAVAGDGAGAAILQRDPDSPKTRLLDSVSHADGSLSDLTLAQPPHGWVKSRKELVSEAVSHISDGVLELLARNGLTPQNISWLVPHSATAPVIDGIQERTGFGQDRMITNFHYRGNLSSACLPSVLSEFSAKGTFSPGELILAPAVGGGFFWGGLLLEVVSA